MLATAVDGALLCAGVQPRSIRSSLTKTKSPPVQAVVFTWTTEYCTTVARSGAEVGGLGGHIFCPEHEHLP